MSDNQFGELKFYASLSFGISLAASMAIGIRSSLCLFANMGATRQLHIDMMESIIQAPVNLYFDVTPIGTILNRFSKDLNQIESNQGFLVGSILQ